MDLQKFIADFADQFDETDPSEITAETKFHDLEEWSSLVALSIISMVDDGMDKRLTGADLRSCSTIEELFNLVEAK